MKFRYEDLEIWQIAIRLVKVVYTILKKYPDDEKFGLISQGRRAVVSIALQVSEGSGRKTNKDFSLFINRALASLQEVDGVLKIGIALEYITYEDYEQTEPLLKEEYYKLISYDKWLNQNPGKYRGYSAKIAKGRDSIN